MKMERIRITDDGFNALALLAEAEKADWFYKPYLNRKTVSVADLRCLADGFFKPQAEYMWRHEAHCDTAQPPELQDIDGKTYTSSVDLVLGIFGRGKIQYNDEEIYG